jgi:N-formylglutamate amidohydrolase
MTKGLRIDNHRGEHIATLFEPQAPAIGVLVNVPHSGETLSEDVDSLVRDEGGLRQQMLQDVDRFVDRIWAQAPLTGATLLVATMNRYVVDLNRAPDDISEQVVEGARERQGPGYYGERGVVWGCTTRRTPVWKRKLEPEEFEARIARFHAPYHAAMVDIMSELRTQHGRAILVDAHSMPSRGRSGHGDEGRPRPDINPGCLGGVSCDPSIRRGVEEHLRAAGLEVRTDDPYRGGFITRHYGRPSQGWHAIQIEINRHLYMDEDSCEEKSEAIAALGVTMVGLPAKLSRLQE